MTLDGSGSSDGDGTIVSYTWSSNTAVSIPNGSTPSTNFSVGTHIVTLTVNDDDGSSVTDTVTIIINTPANNAPTITNPGAQNSTVDDSINLTINASDADNDTLTYSATGFPNGLSINSSSGLIAGTVTTAGSYNPTVTVADGSGDSDSVSFTWEVQAPSPVSTNLSYGKSATQSSTYSNVISPVTNAVDGNTNGNWTAGSVSSTLNESQAWWEVDLGQITDISTIQIWNRTDCCANRLSNFHVFISDEPFSSADLSATQSQVGVTDLAYPGTADQVTSLTVNRTGRYVRVQLAGTNFLTLAEVQVWGRQ